MAQIKAKNKDNEVDITIEGDTSELIALLMMSAVRIAMKQGREDRLPVSLALAGISGLIKDEALRIARIERDEHRQKS